MHLKCIRGLPNAFKMHLVSLSKTPRNHPGTVTGETRGKQGVGGRKPTQTCKEAPPPGINRGILNAFKIPEMHLECIWGPVNAFRMHLGPLECI